MSKGMESVFSRFQGLIKGTTLAASADQFMKEGGKSKPPASTSLGEDDADLQSPTATADATIGSAAAAAKGKTLKNGTAVATAKGKKKKDTAGVDPAKTALVNANIARAIADREELKMAEPFDGVFADHPLIGFTELGGIHTIDLTPKLSPTALRDLRPKGSTAPVPLKVQLYVQTVRHALNPIVPYVTESTVFAITQFLLSPAEWSPKWFVDTTHRTLMRVPGATHDVWGCTLLDLIYTLRELDVYGKKAYTVQIGAERKDTLFLTKPGLVALVTELKALLAPYSISAKHAAANKPAAAAADEIDKAAGVAVADPVPIAAASASAAAAAAPTPAVTPAVQSAKRKATAPVPSSKPVAAIFSDTEEDTEVLAALAAPESAATAAVTKSVVSAPAPHVAVRNTKHDAVTV